MVGTPSYVSMLGVREEIGIGAIKGRIVRGRSQYMRAIEQGEGKLLRKN